MPELEEHGLSFAAQSGMATEVGGVGPGEAAAAPAGSPAAAAAGAPAAAAAAAPLEVPLTRVAVGMWASRRHRTCQLLLLPDQQQLVVLVDRRHAAPKSPSRFSLAGLAVKSPFASGHTRFRTAGCVHTFEVPFASLRGLDYSNPLCLEARLVLEVVHLRKREFSTVRGRAAPCCVPAAALRCIA